MSLKYSVFVPLEFIDDDEMDHADVKTWCFENLKEGSPNALYLSLEDVYLLQYNSEILNIINDEMGDGMLQVGEDDWIWSQEVKKGIYEKLKHYESDVDNERVREILHDLFRLLEISIRTNKKLYFIF